MNVTGHLSASAEHVDAVQPANGRRAFVPLREVPLDPATAYDAGTFVYVASHVPLPQPETAYHQGWRLGEEALVDIAASGEPITYDTLIERETEGCPYDEGSREAWYWRRALSDVVRDYRRPGAHLYINAAMREAALDELVVERPGKHDGVVPYAFRVTLHDGTVALLYDLRVDGDPYDDGLIYTAVVRDERDERDDDLDDAVDEWLADFVKRQLNH